MEQRGIILKIKKRSCVVLTPGGEYRKAPLPEDGKAAVGREITFRQRKSFFNFRYFAVAASLLLLLILSGRFYLSQNHPAVAYLSLDINPSIELAVSADRKVLSARGLNQDGRIILGEAKVKGRDLLEATGIIVSQAVHDGYLAEKDDNVILATLTVDADKEYVVDLESVYRTIQEPVTSRGVEAEIIIQPVDSEVRCEAAGCGLSTGRYLLQQKALKEGIKVTDREINSLSLGKWEKEKKTSLIKIFREENKEQHQGIDNGKRVADGKENEKENGNGDEKGDKNKKGKENKNTGRGIYVERGAAKANQSKKPGAGGTAGNDHNQIKNKSGGKAQDKNDSKNKFRQPDGKSGSNNK